MCWNNKMYIYIYNNTKFLLINIILIEIKINLKMSN